MNYKREGGKSCLQNTFRVDLLNIPSLAELYSQTLSPGPHELEEVGLHFPILQIRKLRLRVVMVATTNIAKCLVSLALVCQTTHLSQFVVFTEDP